MGDDSAKLKIVASGQVTIHLMRFRFQKVARKVDPAQTFNLQAHALLGKA